MKYESRHIFLRKITSNFIIIMQLLLVPFDERLITFYLFAPENMVWYFMQIV